MYICICVYIYVYIYIPCFFGLLVTEAIYVCTRICLRIYAARRQVLCACYRDTMRYGWEFVKTFTPQILCPTLCNPSAINVHMERKNRSSWEIPIVDWSAHVCKIEQARFPSRFFWSFHRSICSRIVKDDIFLDRKKMNVLSIPNDNKIPVSFLKSTCVLSPIERRRAKNRVRSSKKCSKKEARLDSDRGHDFTKMFVS